MTDALLLGITANLGYAAGAVLVSFLRHHPEWDGHVIVLHDGLSDGDAVALGRLYPRLTLRRFDPDVVQERLRAAGIEPPPDSIQLARWSPMILAKFELPDLLAEHAACVWLDADVLIQGRVDSLWQVPCIGWRGLPLRALQRRRDVLRGIDPESLARGIAWPNGGVVAMGPGLRAAGVSSAQAYALAARALTETRHGSVDELVLFRMAAEAGLPVSALAQDFNHPADLAGSAQAAIVHAIGPDKFWNCAALRHAYPAWDAAHDLWVAAGGTPAPQAEQLGHVHPADPSQVVVFARNRAFWQAIWPTLAPALPAGLWPDLRTERPFLRLYPSGQDMRAWIALQRGRRDGWMQIGLGTEWRKLADPALPDRIDRALAARPAVRLTRHDGRRLIEWGAEVRIADVPGHTKTLLEVLTQALAG